MQIIGNAVKEPEDRYIFIYLAIFCNITPICSLIMKYKSNSIYLLLLLSEVSEAYHCALHLLFSYKYHYTFFLFFVVLGIGPGAFYH